MNWYQTISATRIAKLMRKSTNATITAAIGTIRRGKYTLLMRLALPMRLLEASASAVAKKAPRQHAGKDHQRIGRVAVRRQLGQFAEDDREHHHRQERADERPGGANHRLLVAYRDVAPSQDLKQFAVMPQIAPIVPLGAAGFNDQFVTFTNITTGFSVAASCSRPASPQSTFPDHLIAFAAAALGLND